MSDGKRLFTDFLRRTVGRVPVLLVWLGAVAGVYTLSDGNWFTSTLSKGYAEARSYAVAPLRGGVLKTLTVELGDAVKRGQIIATLDGAELAAQRARLSAELVQLQARQKAEEDMLESEVTRGEIWVLKTNAQNQADRAELKELETRLTRLNGLAEQHLVTATDIELARRMYAARAAEIATVDQAVKTGRAGFKSPGTPAPTHKSSVAVRLAPYREAIRVQEAALHELDVQCEQLVLRAPADGRVALIAKRPGEVVPAATAIVNLVTARTGIVEVEVHERVARSVTVGGRVELQRSSAHLGSGRFEGRVLVVAPQIAEAPSRSRPSPQIPLWGRIVLVQVDGPDELLPGEAFDVRFR